MHDGSAKSILLVDDDTPIRQFLTMRLEQEGFEVVQAEDGIDAVVKLRDRLPQVIISDMQMPRMPGPEFMSVVRRRFPAIPVIVLSGVVPQNLLEEIKPDGYFEKSAQKIPELVRALHALTRQRPHLAKVPEMAGPVHVRASGAGYISVPCTDCLRVFQVASPPANETGGNTAVCIHCNFSVSYLIDAAASA
jgi:CheY-like chemotaxis protein